MSGRRTTARTMTVFLMPASPFYGRRETPEPRRCAAAVCRREFLPWTKTETCCSLACADRAAAEGEIRSQAS